MNRWHIVAVAWFVWSVVGLASGAWWLAYPSFPDSGRPGLPPSHVVLTGAKVLPVSWRVGQHRRVQWEPKTGRVVVSWKRGKHLFRVESMIARPERAVIWIDGTRLVSGSQEQTARRLREQALRWWWNDLVWLRPQVLLHHPKAAVQSCQSTRKGMCLLLTLASAGEQHRFDVDAKGRLCSWDVKGAGLLARGASLSFWPCENLLQKVVVRRFWLFSFRFQDVKLTRLAHPVSLPFAGRRQALFLPVLSGPLSLDWALLSFVAIWLLLGGWSLWWRMYRDIVRFPSPLEHPFRYAHVIRHCLSKERCSALVKEAEQAGWMRERHTQPTLDRPLLTLPLGETVQREVTGRVWERLSALFAIPEEQIGWREAFVIKYDPAIQGQLDLHRDASLLTLSIALNDASEYTGGGTFFPCIDRTLVVERAGDGLAHCGKLQHGGRRTVDGYRYVLVCFLDVSSCPAFAHRDIASWDSATPEDLEVMARLYQKEAL